MEFVWKFWVKPLNINSVMTEDIKTLGPRASNICQSWQHEKPKPKQWFLALEMKLHLNNEADVAQTCAGNRHGKAGEEGLPLGGWSREGITRGTTLGYSCFNSIRSRNG